MFDYSTAALSFVIYGWLLNCLVRERQVEIPLRPFFTKCVVVALIYSFSSIISLAAIQVPILRINWFQYLWVILQLASMLSIGELAFEYMVNITRLSAHTRRRLILGFRLVSLAAALLVISTPFTKLIVSFSQSGRYASGPLVWIVYAVFLADMTANFAIYLATLDRFKKRTIILVSVFVLVSVLVLSYFIGETKFAYFASNLILLLFHLIVWQHFQGKQIIYDALTRVYTRAEMLATTELHVTQHSGTPFFIITLSLTSFKQVNQRFGQKNCDVLLKNIASFLTVCAEKKRVYRYSGDEFSIITDSSIEVDVLTTQILERFERPWRLGQYNGYVVPAVISVVAYPSVAETVEEIINGIESSVQAAKADVNSDSCFCTAAMIEAAKRKSAIMDVLRDAVNQQSIEVHYQPILHMQDRRFRTCEALMRIKDDNLGSISPVEFIPIAEESGIIIELTHLLLDKVCKFVKGLLDNDVDFDSVAINLSSVQCMEVGLAQKILGIIEKNEIPYSKISIEITESTLGEYPQLVENMMSVLGAYGILFSIDDFGVGYSNLQSLISLPFSVLKIDRSLIRAASDGQKSAELVRHIVWTMQDIGIKTLAEGVEDSDENAFAVETGVDMIQGFLYARPLPEKEAFDFMLGQARRHYQSVNYAENG